MRLECDVILHWSRQKRGKKADTHQATGVEPTSIALRWRGRPGTVVPGVTGRFMSMRWVASGGEGNPQRAERQEREIMKVFITVSARD